MYRVDSQISPILKKMVEAMRELPTPGSRSPEEVRLNFAAGQKYWNEDPPELPDVTDRNLPGPFGIVTVRHYRPVPDFGSRPVLVFFHGGGWVAGNLDTHDYLARMLAEESGVDVVSVDYGLAPERRFPETLDENAAVLRWLRENGHEWRLDPDRIAIGGDSAGANISLSTALKLRDEGEHWLAFCMLFYSALSPEQLSESHRLYGGIEFGNSPERYRWFWNSYVPDKEMRTDPLANPLLADMNQLPPMFIGISELDPLKDDSLQLCRKLESAAVPFESRVYPGTIHGFLQFLRSVDISREAVKDAARALRQSLTPGE